MDGQPGERGPQGEGSFKNTQYGAGAVKSFRRLPLEQHREEIALNISMPFWLIFSISIITKSSKRVGLHLSDTEPLLK
jgi:hypothetical protein